MSKNLQRHMPYRGPYVYDKGTGDFYIHYHQKCIGRAMDEQYMSSSAIAQLIMAQKEQAVQAAKTHYQQLFLENLSLSQSELNLLKEAFDGDLDSLIHAIDQTVQTNLNAMMDRETLSKFLKTQTHAAKQAPSLVGADVRKALEAFNNILEDLNTVVSLLTEDKKIKDGLMQLLTSCKYKKNIGMSQMGTKLYKEVLRFERNYHNKLLAFENQGLLRAVQAIQTYSKTLSEGKTQSEHKDLTKSNIIDVVDSLFGGGFSETLSSQLKYVVQSNLSNIPKATQTGTDAFATQLTNTDGMLTWFQDETPRQGKTDYKFKNVILTLENTMLPNGSAEIKMNIGVSNKLYRSAGFANAGNEIPSITFNSGSGGTVKEAIESTFKSDRLKYLVYNTLAHQEGMIAANFALNTVLLNRQIVRIFASRGGVDDFSQYIFINGRVISILQLLTYVSKNSVGRSNSFVKRGSSQAAAIHIADRPAMIAAAKITENYERVRAVNQAINDATIVVNIHVKKLFAALSAHELDKI